jgi:hypothetical protein
MGEISFQGFGSIDMVVGGCVLYCTRDADPHFASSTLSKSQKMKMENLGAKSNRALLVIYFWRMRKI